VEVARGSGVVTLVRKDGAWLVRESSDYPAATDRVRELLLGLARLRRLEPKTRNPEFYAKLGLEDVGAKDSRSARVVVKSADGRLLADLIVGERRARDASSGRRSDLFVRLANDPQSWLVEGRLPDYESPRDWLDSEVLRLDPQRIQEVSVTHPSGEKLTIRRKDPATSDFEIVGLPKNAEVKSAALTDSVAATFANLALANVKSAAKLKGEDGPPLAAELATFDGLRVSLQTVKEGKDRLVRLSARFDGSLVEARKAGAKPEGQAEESTGLKPPADVKLEADALNKRWRGWAYLLLPYQLDGIAKSQSDLAKVAAQPEAGKTATGPATTGPAAATAPAAAGPAASGPAATGTGETGNAGPAAQGEGPRPGQPEPGQPEPGQPEPGQPEAKESDGGQAAGGSAAHPR
jgi:uncharacterized protein DUF4340